MAFRKLLTLLILVGACIGCNNIGGTKFISTTIEMRENPEGLAIANPRFSWKFTSNKKDVIQVAYRVEVSESRNDLKRGKNLLWDSGYTKSDKSIFVEYTGTPLQPGKTYYWRVIIRTNKGTKITSRIQQWSTGLGESDWKAKWIGINNGTDFKIVDNRTILPARYLRKEFESHAKPVRAMLYVSGVGSSVCYINGNRVGNDVFGPLPTWYDASVPYLTYDVTRMLKKGANAIGVALGNGRFQTMREQGMNGFGFPRLLLQLELEYSNDSTSTIVSDETWKVTNKGPITENNEFDGEKYDARLELGQWTQPGYDASQWQDAELMDAPRGKLTAQLAPCIKVMEELTPVAVKATGDGRYIVDMGQNMVGIQTVRLRGKKNRHITMRFAEVLKDDSTQLYLDNMRSAQVTDVYIPASDGEFEWEPLFVYHGFRFMEITGLDYEPSVTDFTGKVIYDEMATIGTFETSDDMINKIYRNAYWGIRGNYRGMPTDCPQRDERLGWLGDRTTGAHGESFLFENALLYKKWLKDIEESMNENGSISVVSPRYWSIHVDDVTWPAAYFYVADMLYTQFGDDSSIKERYPSMKKWLYNMINRYMVDDIMPRDFYGDWCLPPESPEMIISSDPARNTKGEILGTSVFYSILKLMEKFAVMNGLPDDAAQYKQYASKMKEAYNRKFFDYETARYDNNTVTANILSLRLGLVPEGYEDRVFANIVEKTEGEWKGHVSVGVVGIQHLMRGLTEHGGLELAYKIATNETYPSWGYMINQGATTIWELWNGDTANPSMNSRNHVMLLGDLLIWFYEELAGIKNDPSDVAFKKILMEPKFPEQLTHVKASYMSPYGKIESEWKRNDDTLSWHIVVPCNSTATIKVPSNLILNADPDNEGIHSVKDSADMKIIEVGSGTYQF